MIAWDWPPRLTFEEQRDVLYLHAQRMVRFSARGLSNVFDIYPRPVRQAIYRGHAR